LAIFIACLGLFGLASFMAENKTKEIGIRKAMGAETIKVVGLLLKQFCEMGSLGQYFCVDNSLFPNEK
jgi:putative ABC transport system permease protein